MNKAHSHINWVNEPNTDTPINANNLNKMDNTIGTLDDRIVVLDSTKANQTDVLTTITNVTLDESTGIFTFTRKNGTTIKLDTKLEKLILNWNYDKNKQILYLILSDGSQMPIDLSSLISQYEFVDSATIRWMVGTDGKVASEIIKGSITGDMLEPNYLANVELYANKALDSSNIATESANMAKGSADLAETYFNGTKNAVSEINKKLNIADFQVNMDGYLTYNDDSSYNFAVDDNGYLNWEVAQ